MKYCTNCGAELPEGMKFCDSCGAPVEEPNQEEHAPPDETATEGQEDEASLTEDGESQTAKENQETLEEEQQVQESLKLKNKKIRLFISMCGWLKYCNR